MRALAIACGLIALFGGMAPASAGKAPPVTPTVTINSLDATGRMFPERCDVSLTLTATWGKGKAPTLWVVDPILVDLGRPVKGVATTYQLPTFGNGQFVDPLRVQLRDRSGEIAADTVTQTITCPPGLELLSVDVVPHATRTDVCTFPITWQANMLPSSGVGDVVMRWRSGTGFIGIETVTAEDLGVPRSVPAGSTNSLNQDHNGATFNIWLDYVELTNTGVYIILGQSNVRSVTATCPPPPE